MKLAVMPPIVPMLAKRAETIPEDDGWIFEPKWDGFRALIFRDANEILIQSRDAKSLNRYFPDLLEPLQAHLPARCVLDGEIVIATSSGLDFDALQLRIHPAASRVRQLAAQTPASIVFFDLLCEGKRDWRNEPLGRRRRKLESLLARAAPPLHLTPATRDRKIALDWFRRFEGAGLDGVMAKTEDGIYEAGKRAMLKIKHERECDCVVAGFRWHKAGEKSEIGSLLLGLYNEKGALQHVGICASFSKAKRRELTALLRPYRKGAAKGHPWIEERTGELTGEQKGKSAKGGAAATRIPGGQSRWSQGKDLSWEPLRPELVAEVAYDHMQGDRFRHVAQFRRWRPDKRPADCTYAQLETVPPEELLKIFGG
jgi:ATP-dependent DNA ligase